ncbi:MAG: DICT sensory domain-containing protein [Scytonema sp. PMC 1069.18]|nr:DICT sensory domain-containing protein [Scytonema sp. PMC 1069.18]MEC4885990.1 DICT sensory domain-containing protein [Scytonema sp. PMC 1070.18]
MDVSLAQDLSVYQLAAVLQISHQPLFFSPAILLALLRAQIDILIQEKIEATLWVKLPPSKIWNFEIQRYHKEIEISSRVINCYIPNLEEEKNSSRLSSDLQTQHTSNSKLQREYFFIILSPQFSSLIVACRPSKRRKNEPGKEKSPKSSSLLTFSTFEDTAIQYVLNGIKKAMKTEISSLRTTDFVCSSALNPTLTNQLLVRQLQRQDEINRQRATKHLTQLQQQKQKLLDNIQYNDEYLRNMCQELRTPLTHMKTALSLLNSPNLKVPQRQRYIQMLNTQCDRQNALITSVLELLQLERNLESMPLEPIRLADVVPGVVSIYQPIAKEKGIMLAYTVPTELPSVWCVSGGLRQIVINILSNSIKFTRSGGKVWVRARLQGEGVQLEFRDTGIGIAESEIPKIFERFYRVRPQTTDEFSGVGLGLTIVQYLVKRCGGSISVKSRINEGSIFTVELLTVKS